MAKINFDDEKTQERDVQQVVVNNDNPQNEIVQNVAPENDNRQEEGNQGNQFENDVDINIGGMADITLNDKGLSLEEMNDSNKIKVTIADYNTPLVILFGPPACGKTMTMVRLTRYLQKKGYSVQPETTFRPAYDKNYIGLCEKFNEVINSDNAAAGNTKINFMLVQVRWQGKPICQILEAPGEDYFNPQKVNNPFPRYINAIISSKNRKIWAIITEPDTTSNALMKEEISRKHYVSKIGNLKTKISPRDKVMFIFNKVDATPFVIGPGNIKYDLLFQHTEYLYPNIFVPFKNENPISRLWRPYNCDFVAFQTGDYSVATDGTRTFEQGPDVYPAKLWDVIHKRIRG